MTELNKVEPLKSRTMTLGELQRETLALIKKVKRQLRRSPHEGGLSDEEFIDEVLESLETTIHQDREMLKMHKTTEQEFLEFLEDCQSRGKDSFSTIDWKDWVNRRSNIPIAESICRSMLMPYVECGWIRGDVIRWKILRPRN